MSDQMGNDTLSLIEDITRKNIREFFTDPGEFKTETKGYYESLKSLCEKYGFDFGKIVEEEVKPEDIQKMEEIINDSTEDKTK